MLPKKGGHATRILKHRDDAMRNTKLLERIHNCVHNMRVNAPGACDAKFATTTSNFGASSGSRAKTQGSKVLTGLPPKRLRDIEQEFYYSLLPSCIVMVAMNCRNYSTDVRIKLGNE